MPFIGTASNTKNIDLLRQALDEETLSFYGRSFGSYIGTVYATQFPRRVRAMVLDGAYDPRRYADVPYAYDAGQFVALDTAVGRFLDWCAQNATACGFGEGWPRQAFEQLKRSLDADPVITASGRPATGYTLAYRLMFNINAGKEIWPYLGQALRAAQAHQGSFLLSPPLPRVLRLPQRQPGRGVRRPCLPGQPPAPGHAGQCPRRGVARTAAGPSRGERHPRSGCRSAVGREPGYWRV
ncbi:alpha/beta fold hydrolase [Streptomyces sp. ISL-86]|uniref:alpha/beta fold hydrolase n=1 Tax=Streptomyces sp. ISL-86 TaxID=2819187 RepID=UPI0035A847D9